MSYLDLFQRYGNPSREAEIRLTAYLLRPDALTANLIKSNDETAARMIARCNEHRLRPVYGDEPDEFDGFPLLGYEII